jgi:1-deoxy-D-xylulose-5-phosphate reductoisomerase
LKITLTYDNIISLVEVIFTEKIEIKRIAIFGSTGSIGDSTLNVIRENPTLFKAVTLVAGKNIEKLKSQIEVFNPQNVYIIDEQNAEELKSLYPNLNVYFGAQGMDEISNLTDFDIAVSAMVGIAGLKPTYQMIKNGKTVALANKEVLVTGGELIMKTAKESGAKLLTVDSEHSAIMQCLNGEESNPIDKILLTASGGPFFDKPITDDITVEEALNHPTWNMGKKVTIDSSTMMNKGFEVIEAKWLFDVNPDQIEVVVHRKSFVHSMVQFKDGTIMASIGPKAMQIPIAYALNFPNRLPNRIEKLDLFEIADLKFEKPDLNKFKCLRLAYDAIKKGHSFQVVLNAANEVLVDAFLNKKIKYTDIPNKIEEVMNSCEERKLQTVEEILEYDKEIREITERMINQ